MTFPGRAPAARIVLELARRGRRGDVVALGPGGFWNDRPVAICGATVGTSVALTRRIQPALPILTRNPAGRTALLAQFSARPWKLPGTSSRPSYGGPRPPRAWMRRWTLWPAVPASTAPGWPCLAGSLSAGGRQDKATLPGRAATATRRYPDATLH